MLMINNADSKNSTGIDSAIEVTDVLTKKDGFFIEVGAGDGIDQSMTNCLEKNRWQGILVESDIVKCGHCTVNRPKSAVLNYYCIGSDFTEPLSYENTMNTAAKKGKPRSLKSILNELEIEKADLLVINTQNRFTDILNGLNLSVFTPEFILIKESLKMTGESYLNNFGYSVVRYLRGESFYRCVLYQKIITQDIDSNEAPAPLCKSEDTIDDRINLLTARIAENLRVELNHFLKKELE